MEKNMIIFLATLPSLRFTIRIKLLLTAASVEAFPEKVQKIREKIGTPPIKKLMYKNKKSFYFYFETFIHPWICCLQKTGCTNAAHGISRTSKRCATAMAMHIPSPNRSWPNKSPLASSLLVLKPPIRSRTMEPAWCASVLHLEQPAGCSKLSRTDEFLGILTKY